MVATKTAATDATNPIVDLERQYNELVSREALAEQVLAEARESAASVVLKARDSAYLWDRQIIAESEAVEAFEQAKQAREAVDQSRRNLATISLELRQVTADLESMRHMADIRRRESWVRQHHPGVIESLRSTEQAIQDRVALEIRTGGAPSYERHMWDLRADANKARAAYDTAMTEASAALANVS